MVWAWWKPSHEPHPPEGFWHLGDSPDGFDLSMVRGWVLVTAVRLPKTPPTEGTGGGP